MVVPVIFFHASAVEGRTAIPPPIAIFKLLWSRKYQPSFFPAVNTLFNALVNNEEFKQLDHSNLKITWVRNQDICLTFIHTVHRANHERKNMIKR
jgi:hypothetical protein